jgi:hypothetical protein
MTVFQGLLAGRSGMMLVGVLLSEGGFQPIRSGFATKARRFLDPENLTDILQWSQSVV